MLRSAQPPDEVVEIPDNGNSAVENLLEVLEQRWNNTKWADSTRVIVPLKNNLGWIVRDWESRRNKHDLFWVRKDENEYNVWVVHASDIWIMIVQHNGLMDDYPDGITTNNHKKEWYELTKKTDTTYDNNGKSWFGKGIVEEQQGIYFDPIHTHLEKVLDNTHSQYERRRHVKRLHNIIHGLVVKNEYAVYKYPGLLSHIHQLVKKYTSKRIKQNQAEEKISKCENEIFSTIINIFHVCWAQLLFLKKEYRFLTENQNTVDELWDLFQFGEPKVLETVGWYLKSRYGRRGKSINDDEMQIVLKRYISGSRLNNFRSSLDKLIEEKSLILDDYYIMKRYLESNSQDAKGLLSDSLHRTLEKIDDTIAELKDKKDKKEVTPKIPEGITRQHVLAALEWIKEHGVPKKWVPNYYFFFHEGKRYSPKYVLINAIKNATQNDYPSGEFTEAEAMDFLKKFGFEVLLEPYT